MKPLTKYKILFDITTGDMVREKNYYDTDADIVERDNIPFHDTLRYVEYDVNDRTKSVFVKMIRTDGSHVFMFFSDFAALIPLMRDGTITGEWAFVKRGPKFGCYMINHIPQP